MQRLCPYLEAKPENHCLINHPLAQLFGHPTQVVTCFHLCSFASKHFLSLSLSGIKSLVPSLHLVALCTGIVLRRELNTLSCSR